MAWRVPPEWRELYSRENYCQKDPAFRHARRTVLPFDWASAPYNPETEPQMGEVIERARDLNVHKSISVPIPLNVSQRTVEWHLRKVYKKLGATNRVQALALLGDTRSMLDPLG
jgi:DNA-binding transcriptional ArsR family regulator